MSFWSVYILQYDYHQLANSSITSHNYLLFFFFVVRTVFFSHEKEEVLPFVTTLMDLEGITERYVRQRNTNIVQYHLYVEY